MNLSLEIFYQIQNSTPALGPAGAGWWETGGREEGDVKFENEDKCFKVSVFVEKGEVVGESWRYHCHKSWTPYCQLLLSPRRLLQVELFAWWKLYLVETLMDWNMELVQVWFMTAVFKNHKEGGFCLCVKAKNKILERSIACRIHNPIKIPYISRVSAIR